MQANLQANRLDIARQQIIEFLGTLVLVLNRDGFVIFISGAKELGKTDIALLLAEVCHILGFRRHIATNIRTDSYMIEKQITNYDDLKRWLLTSGRKLFVLDEAGTSLKKMRFMSEKNQLIMDTIQLIRHYDAGFIGIAPSDVFIDNNFLNTDILDARIKKISLHTAQVKDYLNRESYFLLDVPRTSIRFNSKDVAEFSLHGRVQLKDLPLCCAVAKVYAETGSYKAVSKQFDNMNPKEIRRHLRNHLKHGALPPTQATSPPSEHQESAEPKT
jgi:hypothetical protein